MRSTIADILMDGRLLLWRSLMACVKQNITKRIFQKMLANIDFYTRVHGTTRTTIQYFSNKILNQRDRSHKLPLPPPSRYFSFL